MKRSLLACALALAAVGCQNSGPHINDHWNVDSVAPRVGRFFLGYDAQKDGNYRDFAWQRKQHINLTMRRHLFNHNPDNPNHADIAQRRRPKNSILPDPVTFIHLEGLLLGFGLYAGGGTFIPVPVDSILGIFEEGGGEEFFTGISDTFTRSEAGAVTATSAHNAIREEGAEPVIIFHRLGD